MPLTDAKAESMRAELEAHEAAKRKEARAAEAEKRAAARAVLAPAATFVDTKLKPLRETLDGVIEGLGREEWDLGNLIRNLAIVADSVIDRTARRIADTEPPPAEPDLPSPSVPLA